MGSPILSEPYGVVFGDWDVGRVGYEVLPYSRNLSVMGVHIPHSILLSVGGWVPFSFFHFG
jgi:hypothetical protein